MRNRWKECKRQKLNEEIKATKTLKKETNQYKNQEGQKER